ncbi:MAG: exonuclease domain-containing protein [Acidimicrobiales bacterium]
MEGQRSWTGGELLAFDLETTGVDRFSDVPVSFALVTMAEGRVTGRQGSLVDPGRPIPPGATEIHGITTERARDEGVPLAEAVAALADALVDASRRGVPVVGMNLHYDLTILDVQSHRLLEQGLDGQGFAGPVLDALVLDRHFDRYRKGRRRLGDLCGEYRVTIDRAHDAGADAEATLGVLAAMCRRYPALCAASLAELHRSQAVWHREWATSYDRWRQKQGLDPLDPRDADWPMAPFLEDVAEVLVAS